MPFKIIEASSTIELESKLNEWETDNPGITVMEYQLSSFGNPSFLGQVLPGKSQEKHVMAVHYTET